MAKKPEHVIEIKGLEKSFGPKKVLDGIDLKIEKGQSVVVIGGSGSGKSVLLKCILGLLDADGGEILIDGENMVGAGRAKKEHLRHKFGMLFQGGALFDSLPVWENIAFALLARGLMSQADAKEKAVLCLRKVGLPDETANLFPAELSGGMQKRVALARAIAPDPEIIFFDEPTTGLDPIMADVINDLISSCVTDLGATALSISHDMASVRKIASKVAMLYQGHIIWQGPVSEIDSTENAFVGQFVNGLAAGPIQLGQAQAG